jgi:hypothetical protein
MGNLENWSRINPFEPTIDGHRARYASCDDLILPYGDGIVPLMGLLPKWILRRYVPEKVRIDGRAWLGWAAEHYRHGLAIDSTDIALLSNSLKTILAGGEVPLASEQLAKELRSETMEGGFRSKWC